MKAETKAEGILDVGCLMSDVGCLKRGLKSEVLCPSFISLHLFADQVFYNELQEF